MALNNPQGLICHKTQNKTRPNSKLNVPFIVFLLLSLLAVFQMPAAGNAIIPQTQTIPLTLICDSIQDSGNMGSLIRTAAAVGCARILTTSGKYCSTWWP